MWQGGGTTVTFGRRPWLSCRSVELYLACCSQPGTWPESSKCASISRVHELHGIGHLAAAASRVANAVEPRLAHEHGCFKTLSLSPPEAAAYRLTRTLFRICVLGAATACPVLPAYVDGRRQPAGMPLTEYSRDVCKQPQQRAAPESSARNATSQLAVSDPTSAHGPSGEPAHEGEAGAGAGTSQVASILASFRLSSERSTEHGPGTDLSLDPFLDAFEKLTSFFDALGATLLADFLRKEIAKRAAVVRAAAGRCGELLGEPTLTVRALIAADQESPGTSFFKSAPRPLPALLWIGRVLDFVRGLVVSLCARPEISVSTAAVLAYKGQPLW
jgi:hypothetical protein